MSKASDLALRLRTDAQRGRDMVAKCEVKGYPRGDDYPLADSRAGDLMWELALKLDEAADLLLEQEQSTETLTIERNWNASEADRQASLAARLNADLTVAKVRLEAAEELLRDWYDGDLSDTHIASTRTFLSLATLDDEYIRRVNAVADELEAEGVTYDTRRFARLTEALVGGEQPPGPATDRRSYHPCGRCEVSFDYCRCAPTKGE